MDDDFYPSSEDDRALFEKYERWNAQDLEEADIKWKEENPCGPSEKSPSWQAHGVRHLKFHYENYQKEKKSSILDAVWTCMWLDLPIPAWLKSALFKAITDVKSYNAKSWEDVFGMAHSKGTNLEAKRKRNKLEWAVYLRITEIKQKNASIPIDAGLFEEVGGEFGIGKTLAQDYYYNVKKIFSRRVREQSR